MTAETKQLQNLMDLIVNLGYDIKPITIGELMTLQGDIKDKTPDEVVNIIQIKLEPKIAHISFDEDFD